METGKLTGYQKKVPGNKWKCLRVDLDDTQCDVYLFYRNNFRISLSKLLSVGFVLFFDRIIEELAGDSDEQKEDLVWFLYTYTEIQALLWNVVTDSFKYFDLPAEKKT